MQLDALYQISNVLASSLQQQDRLLNILDILEVKLNMVRGTIMLLSLDSSELTIEAVKSFTHEIDPEITYKWGEGIIGKVVSTGKSAVIPHIYEEPLFRDRIHRRKEQQFEDVSFICVPIQIGNEVVGTLSVDIPDIDTALLPEKERVLQIISSMIANDVNAQRNALTEKKALQAENLSLRDALGEDFRPETIIGTSKAMRDVYMKIYQVSKADTTVLIRGESGTGKELVASAIHFGSQRKDKKLVKVNCAALSENLLESELFGHEKGAFTGALFSRIGRIEEAQGGTLFLDEIGELSQTVQVKLLRFFQEREFERVGSNKTITSDVRIIVATNRDLEQAVTDGHIRTDFYYRINVFSIYLPPLRERKEDILPVANYFVEKYASKLNKEVRRISTPAISAMMSYHWPGNIRELENCMEHAVLVCKEGVIHGYDLPPTLQIPSTSEITGGGKLKERVENLERDLIIDSLKLTNGHINSAASELGITSRMLRYKIENLHIDLAFFTKPLAGKKLKNKKAIINK